MQKELKLLSNNCKLHFLYHNNQNKRNLIKEKTENPKDQIWVRIRYQLEQLEVSKKLHQLNILQNNDQSHQSLKNLIRISLIIRDLLEWRIRNRWCQQAIWNRLFLKSFLRSQVKKDQVKADLPWIRDSLLILESPKTKASTWKTNMKHKALDLLI